MAYIEVKHLNKVYETEEGIRNEALSDVNFIAKEGEVISIMGESGSGKSTLLNMMACLDYPTAGTITVNGRRLEIINDDAATEFRRDHIGFVFQNFNLLNIFDNKDNILMPVVISGKDVRKYNNQLHDLAGIVGITPVLNKYPYELSGGQQQRVAIARALIMDPDLILADEPTGQLDSKTSNKILDLLSVINKENKTILMVTHSPNAASYANRVLFIKDGVIFNQLDRGNDSKETFLNKIIMAQAMI